MFYKWYSLLIVYLIIYNNADGNTLSKIYKDFKFQKLF